MLKSKIIGLVLLSFGTFYTAIAQSAGENLEVTMVEEFVISDTKSQISEFIFGEPETIFTDSEGNIYITDSKSLKIWVFDDKGNYLKSIGNEGKGPGEFLELNLAFINNRDEIYVPDPMQFRVTKFNTNGDVLNTISTSRAQDINFFRQVLPLDTNRFLVLYYKSGEGRFAKYSRKGLFHVWNNDFQKEVTAYGKFEQLGFNEPSYGRRSIRNKVGTMAQQQNGNILLAPFLYEGNILTYKKQQNGWHYESSIIGLKSNQPAWVELDENDPEAGSIHTYGLETVYGTVNILSSGIFTLNSNYIVHFSVQKNNNKDNEEWGFGVEVFDKKLEYQGYYPLETLDRPYTLHDSLIQWKDDSGRFYMLDQEEGIPVVRVFSLDIKKK